MDFNELRRHPDRAVLEGGSAHVLLEDDVDVLAIKNLLSVRGDFDLALCACRLYMQCAEIGVPAFELRVLYDAAVIAYWRPFASGTRPDGLKGRSVKGLLQRAPEDLRMKHESLAMVRDKRIAHRDFRQTEDPQVPQVIGVFDVESCEIKSIYPNLLDGSFPDHIETIGVLSNNFSRILAVMIGERVQTMTQRYRDELASGTLQLPAGIRHLRTFS